jgi:hypothetical protein
MVNRKTPPRTPSPPPPPPRSPGWYAGLEAARRVAAHNKGLLTSRTLSTALEIPLPVASAWCSKFVDWGYLELAGTHGGGRGRGRPTNVYRLTKYGLQRETPQFSRAGGTPCPRCGGTGVLP